MADTGKDLVGKLVVITGANSGIGFEAATLLAKRGAEIVLCCRNEKKAEEAKAEIAKRSGLDFNKLHVAQLDLADLDNIGTFRSRYNLLPGLASRPVDILILNAGLMAIPHRELTKQKIEMQMGVNVVGHFKFAAEMFDVVKAAPHGRIVSVASLVHIIAKTINVDDFNRDKHYNKWTVYGESKLGNLLFTSKLNRLLEEKGVTNVVAVACHPGYTSTNLERYSFIKLSRVMGQGAVMGSTPTVLAATDPNAERDDYAGPKNFFWGRARWGRYKTKYAYRKDLQDKLWEKCEELTKCDFAGRM